MNMISTGKRERGAARLQNGGAGIDDMRLVSGHAQWQTAATDSRAPQAKLGSLFDTNVLRRSLCKMPSE